jgi:hypothetical protein
MTLAQEAAFLSRYFNDATTSLCQLLIDLKIPYKCDKLIEVGERGY